MHPEYFSFVLTCKLEETGDGTVDDRTRDKHEVWYRRGPKEIGWGERQDTFILVC